MTAKPVVPRERAGQDIDDALDYYLSHATAAVARGFVDALEKALAHIGCHPGSGSSRYAYALDLPGLRTWPLTGYPHVVFYLERADHIDVWRVLHGGRDVPAWMTEL